MRALILPLALLALLLLSLSIVPRVLGALYLSGSSRAPLATPTFQAGPITVVTPEATPEPTPSATPEQSADSGPAPAEPPAPTAPPQQAAPPAVAVAPPAVAAPIVRALPAPVNVASLGNPAGEVAAFYQAVQAHNFGAAQATWSASMQSRYPPDVYIFHRFAATRSITLLQDQVTSNNGQVAYVSVNLIEVMNDGSTRHWVGSWQLVRSGSGWLLNQPYFG